MNSQLLLAAFPLIILLMSSRCDGVILDIRKIFQLITDLNDFYNFTSFIVLKDEHFHRKFYGLDLFEVLLLEIFEVPLVTMKSVDSVNVDDQSNKQINRFVNYNSSLSFTFITKLGEADSPDETILDRGLTELALRGMHNSKAIFIVVEPVEHFSLLKAFFRDYAWFNGFLNVIAIFIYRNQTHFYTYNPFPRMQLINLTEYQSVGELYYDKIKNLNRYKIKMPLYNDPPRVFSYRTKSNNWKYAGVGNNLIRNYIRQCNGTLEQLEFYENSTQRNVEIVEILGDIFMRQIHFTAHPYGLADRSLLSVSYPCILAKFCLIAPVKRSIESYMYILHPFQLGIWLAIVALVAYISVITKCTLQYIEERAEHIRQFYRVLCAVMYIPTPVIPFKYCWKNFSIYLQIYVFGFLLSNLYLTTLTSFLTKMPWGKQVDTVQDFIDAQMPIMSSLFETLSFLENDHYPNEFVKLFRGVSADQLHKHFYALNTSYAYPIVEDQWEFVLHQQRDLRRPLLRVTSTCFAYQYLGFPMFYDSPFLESLSYFTMLCHQYGLIVRWHRQSFVEGVRANILKLHFEDKRFLDYKPLSMRHMRFGWFVFCFGCAVALLCFMVERCCKKAVD